MNRFLDQLGKKIVVWDGGTGTYLQNRGLKPGELPETWNVLHPEVIVQMHREYLRAGADVIDTNTFGAHRLKYGDPEAGPGNLASVVRAALDCAEEARRLENRPDAAIALDLGPTGHMLAPLGDLSFEDAVSLYKEVIALAEDRADLILIETMTDAYELKAAVLAAKEASGLPVAATCAFGADEKLLTGLPPEGEAALLEGLGVSVLGVNCSLGPKQMRNIVKRLLAVSSVPVAAVPNAGMPRVENGRTVYDVGAEDFAEEVSAIARDGAWAVGGCCGTTPEYIRHLKEAVMDLTPKPFAPKHRTAVTSFSRVQTIGLDQAPVLIGERINPTGKKKLKDALTARDYGYILREASKQEDAGAQILDVNTGVPGIDEEEVLTETVERLQSVNPLPLQIDTSDIRAMESALRIYNGRPLVNSANGREEICRRVFPLAAKYGGVVVCLLLDEHGIPDTADGRIAIAKKIIRIAGEYGLTEDDLVFDALALTVSSDSRAASCTLETLRRLRTELRVNSILGVSNISFGLPYRGALNAAFFTMAMEEGLSCAIINPCSAEMMQAYDTWRTLSGYDRQCAAYIGKYSQLEKRRKAEAAENRKAREEAAEGRRAVRAMRQVAELAASAGFAPENSAAPRGSASAGAGFSGLPQDSAVSGNSSGEGRSQTPGGPAEPKQPAEPGTAASASEEKNAGSGAAAVKSPKLPGESPELMAAVGKGLSEDAGKAAAALIASGTDPMDLISHSLVPALNLAGAGFEKGTVYLPQLLMSAEAANAAFAQVRAFFEKNGTKQKEKGVIVLAAVKGDIHDIGKNIVKVLLENYGYRVIDLGRDVEPRKIVEAARESGAPLVGLSALMTTTVGAMEETIRLVHRELPGVKVIAGGAVLTQEYADQIHADAYAADAMAAVRYAEKLFGRAGSDGQPSREKR